MTPHEHLVFEIAEATTDRVVRRAIRALQQLTNGLQSGDDSDLRNTWDEMCVQVQVEHSGWWAAYEHTARSVLGREAQRLSPQELSAVWLQTDAGEDWLQSEGEDVKPGYSLDDVVDHVASALLSRATDYSNARIRAYIDR